MSHVFHRRPRQDYPVAVAGHGSTLIDRAGRRCLAASGGAAVSCLGHGQGALGQGLDGSRRQALRMQQLDGRAA